MSYPHAVIVGCSTTELLPEEAALFARFPPMGCILFARNIVNPVQVRGLVSALKAAAGWDMPIWIDQEGGRVQRFRAPNWTNYPAMEYFGLEYSTDPERALRLLDTATALLAADLRDLGVDVDCHPVLDLHFAETHDVIGNRAFAADVETIQQCGATVIAALKNAGVVPIMKHFPGHGRAQSDSHLELPYVHASLADLMQHDVVPFVALKATPMVMTAHIVYPHWDDSPATLSAKILQDFWRDEVGYTGLIVSDDLDMKALAQYGTPSALLAQTLNAGADLALYCTGDYQQNQAVLRASPAMSTVSWQRWQQCEAIRQVAPSRPDAARCNEYWAWAATIEESCVPKPS